MYNFNTALENKKIEQYSANLKHISPTDTHLLAKIHSKYINKVKYMGMSEEEYTHIILSRIESNDIPTIVEFVKDVSKQNIYEPIQIDILSAIFKQSFKRYNRESYDDTKTFDGIGSDGKMIAQCKYINESG